MQGHQDLSSNNLLRWAPQGGRGGFVLVLFVISQIKGDLLFNLKGLPTKQKIKNYKHTLQSLSLSQFWSWIIKLFQRSKIISLLNYINTPLPNYSIQHRSMRKPRPKCRWDRKTYWSGLMIGWTPHTIIKSPLILTVRSRTFKPIFEKCNKPTACIQCNKTLRTMEVWDFLIWDSWHQR